MLVIDKLAPYDQAPVTQWIAVYTGADGRQVRLDEYNSESAGVPLTRTNPPLTTAQLTAAVTGSVWDPVFDAFTRGPTAPANPNGAGSPVPSASEILAKTEPLLPVGLTHHDGTSQDTPGAAHLSVTSGRRTSTLNVTVVPLWQQGQETNPRAVFEAGAGSALSHTVDGASVITRVDGATKAGGGPATVWHVDVLLANGTRIMIDEWNGTSGYEFPPGTPVLSLDQLKSIATSDVWSH